MHTGKHHVYVCSKVVEQKEEKGRIVSNSCILFATLLPVIVSLGRTLTRSKGENFLLAKDCVLIVHSSVVLLPNTSCCSLSIASIFHGFAPLYWLLPKKQEGEGKERALLYTLYTPFKTVYFCL